MKKFIFRLVTFYIIVCFFVTSLSCAVNPVTGKKQLMLLSEQDELNLGNSVFPNAIWGSDGGGGEYKDEKLRGYLESIVNRIHQISHRPDDEVIFGDILSTHPRTRVRIDEIERLITTSTKYQIFGDGVGRDYFQYMISDLKRVNKIYRNYYDKAVREFKRKNLYEAERLLKIALQHDTTQPPFYALYGFIHLQYKNDYEAEKYFNYALSLQNNYQPAFRGLGIINYKRNNYYGTIEILNRALRLFPEDINSMYYLGMTYYKIKDFSKALSHMTKFAQSRPDHPEINGYIGICYEKIGDIYSAYNSYKRQVEIDSTNEIGRYSYQRAIELKKIIDLEKEKEKQKKKKKGKENK